jgi:hypothetical protein
MAKMTGLERVLTALRLEEPDIVPHFERVAQRVVNGILPGASYEDLVEYLDVDGVRFIDRTNSWHYQMVDEARRIKRDQWGGLVRYTGEDNPVPMEPAIMSEKDLDNYVLPDPDEEWRYDYLRQMVQRFKGERAIVVGVTDIFALGRENFLGDVGYFRGMVKNPEFIERTNALLLDYQLRYIKNCVEVGADIFWINGDWAMTERPMVSREFTERFLVPPFRRLVEHAHSLGAPCIKHTDGNIWPIYDLIRSHGGDGHRRGQGGVWGQGLSLRQRELCLQPGIGNGGGGAGRDERGDPEGGQRRRADLHVEQLGAFRGETGELRGHGAGHPRVRPVPAFP